MLFIYVSLNKQLVIGCLDLPVSMNQRSSLCSRRTRRELRDRAQSMIGNNLRRDCIMDGHDRVVTVGVHNFEGRPMAGQTMNCEYSATSLKLMLMLDGSRF
jgi:hypothetical protein